MDEFKKIILPILGAAAFICAVGLWYKNQPAPGPTTTEVIINNAKIKAEVARSQAERQKGLADRSGLAAGTGMLFVIPSSEGIPTFWMKGMKFGLDIIWIKEGLPAGRQGKIIQIDKDVSPPAADTPDNQLKRYTPQTPVDYVLEVNAGFCDTNKIKVGDNFEIQSDQVPTPLP